MVGQTQSPLAPPKDIMMAVSSEHALREAELLNLRQIATAMDRVVVRLDGIDGHMSDVRERTARMEERSTQVADLKQDIEKLHTRVEGLQEDLLQRKSMGKFVTIIKDFTPWVVFLATAALAVAGKVHVG